MQLIGLTDLLRESTVYREVLARLDKTESQTLNVIRAARPFLLAALAADWNGAILYLTARGKRTYNVAEQLPVWLDDETRIYRFAEPTPMFYDRLPWDSTVIRERLQTLNALLSAEAMGAKPIVIAPARALMQRTMPVNQFRKRTQTLAVGQRYQIDALIHEWVALGYEH